MSQPYTLLPVTSNYKETIITKTWINHNKTYCWTVWTTFDDVSLRFFKKLPAPPLIEENNPPPPPPDCTGGGLQ